MSGNNDCGGARCDVLIAVIFGSACVLGAALFTATYVAKRVGTQWRAWKASRLNPAKGAVDLQLGVRARDDDTLVARLTLGGPGGPAFVMCLSMRTLQSMPFVAEEDSPPSRVTGPPSAASAPDVPGTPRSRRKGRMSTYLVPSPSTRAPIRRPDFVDHVRVMWTPHGFRLTCERDVGRLREVFHLIVEHGDDAAPQQGAGPGRRPGLQVRGCALQSSYYHHHVVFTPITGAACFAKVVSDTASQVESDAGVARVKVEAVSLPPPSLGISVSTSTRRGRAWHMFRDLNRQKSLTAIVGLVPPKGAMMPTSASASACVLPTDLEPPLTVIDLTEP
jgi:hypothetical protein